MPVRARSLEDCREFLESRIRRGTQRARLRSSPSPRFAWRSRFEPSGAAASFTWSARSRSRPTPASTSSRSARHGRRIVDVDTRDPEVAAVEADAEARVRSEPVDDRASSSIERPIVPPAPAEFSSRSQVVSAVRSSARASAGTTRSRPASKPAPRCEPTWNTTSASISRATSRVVHECRCRLRRERRRAMRG